MAPSTRRENFRAPLTLPQARATEGRPEPIRQSEDELGLLGHDADPRTDRLDWLDLSSKPEDYFSRDPQNPHREVL